MVTKVNATTEFRLLANADQVVRSIARDALIAFSINRLRELKLVTANFKNGFDFSDGYYVRYDLKKFYKIIINTIYKAVAFLDNNVEANMPFIEIRNSNRPSFRISCIFDQALIRYVRRLNNTFTAYNLPFTIALTDMYQPGDYMRIELLCNADRNEVSLETYKLLLLIPESLQILKTLSRKAKFRDEHFRNLNRSGRVGYEAQRTA